jgi:hypothetical protein
LKSVLGENKHSNNFAILFSNVQILQVMKKSKYLEKPNDNNYHNHNVEDPFDLTIHGDECIHKP